MSLLTFSRLAFAALVVLAHSHSVLAEGGGRMVLDAQTDDCALYHALNGKDAIPEACRENDSKAPFGQSDSPIPVVLERVNFDLNSNQLTSAARTDLARVAKVMSDPISRRQVYNVFGYTDRSGDQIKGLNRRLSERRAQVTRRYLIAMGVPSDRLPSAQGFGSQGLYDPAHPYDPVNRRVEVLNAESAR